MTPVELAAVRDLTARLRIAEQDLHRLQRQHEAEIARAKRRIVYLKRDKALALKRARQATDNARYWHGVAIAKEWAA